MGVCRRGAREESKAENSSLDSTGNRRHNRSHNNCDQDLYRRYRCLSNGMSADAENAFGMIGIRMGVRDRESPTEQNERHTEDAQEKSPVRSHVRGSFFREHCVMSSADNLCWELRLSLPINNFSK